LKAPPGLLILAYDKFLGRTIKQPTHQTPVQHRAWFCSGTDCNWLEVCLNLVLFFCRTEHAQTQNHAAQLHRTKLGAVKGAAWEPAFLFLANWVLASE